jgi:hypothetical protein
LEALVGVSRGKGPLQSSKGHNKREKKKVVKKKRNSMKMTLREDIRVEQAA